MELFDQFYAIRDSIKDINTICCKTAHIYDGKLHTLIYDIFELFALGDYISDFSALPKSFTYHYITSGVNVETPQLPKPHRIDMETEE